MARGSEDLRELGRRVWWLVLATCLAFTSMTIIVWSITSFIRSCGDYRWHASFTGADVIVVLAGTVGLTLAWYKGLACLDRHLGWRSDRRLARAWLATRKRDRARRATTRARPSRSAKRSRIRAR